MSEFTERLKQRFGTPQRVLEALGLPASLTRDLASDGKLFGEALRRKFASPEEALAQLGFSLKGTDMCTSMARTARLGMDRPAVAMDAKLADNLAKDTAARRAFLRAHPYVARIGHNDFRSGGAADEMSAAESSRAWSTAMGRAVPDQSQGEYAHARMLEERGRDQVTQYREGGAFEPEPRQETVDDEELEAHKQKVAGFLRDCGLDEETIRQACDMLAGTDAELDPDLMSGVTAPAGRQATVDTRRRARDKDVVAMGEMFGHPNEFAGGGRPHAGGLMSAEKRGGAMVGDSGDWVDRLTSRIGHV
jgi:hypothetical protein